MVFESPVILAHARGGCAIQGQGRVCSPRWKWPPLPFSVLKLQHLTPPNSELWFPDVVDTRPATLSVPQDPAPPGEKENDLWEGAKGVVLSITCHSTSAKPASKMLA